MNVPDPRNGRPDARVARTVDRASTELELVQPGEAGSLAALERAGALTGMALILSDPNMPYAQYEELGVLFGRVHPGVKFWIGDWPLFGEARYGEEAAQAAE